MSHQSGVETPIQGCRTTRIYCLPHCPAGSRMKPENRVQFHSREEARACGYRACKICKPDGPPVVAETFYLSDYESPIGPYVLVSSQKGVVLLESADRAGEQIAGWERQGIQIREGEGHNDQAIRELDAYFAGKLRQFGVPLDLRGTDFQRRVWEALQRIPYGEHSTYGKIAAAVGNPKACRAVGRANGSNPVAIIVPCHRVIGTNGKLVGYAGGLDKKKALLDLEASARD